MSIPSRFDVLVVMTGRQLWSHLDALAQWGNDLKHLVILAARRDGEPGGPVDRLRRFARDAFPQLTVRVVGPVDDDDPRAVLDALSNIAHELGGKVVVNASGGTRLMFLGATQASRLIPSVTTVFRDDDGPWYHLSAEGSAENLGFLDADATQRFGVVELLGVTWADETRQVVHRPGRPPKHLFEAAAECIAGKHFVRAFNEAQVRAGHSASDGHAFEYFVQAVITQLAAGAADVVVSVELRDKTRGIQEVDLVVNANGRLHVIDCKYRARTEVPIGTQIREAYATRQLLGDDAAQMILLRPLLSTPEQSRALASDYGIRLLDSAALSSRSLPDQLALLLGLDPGQS